VLTLGLVITAFATTPPASAQEPMTDPYQWLEDVEGTRSLDWVRARNAESTKALTESAAFGTLRDRLKSIYDSNERIPFVGKMGDYYYNFWQDEKNPRGLWRRTTLDEYRKPEPKWDVLLDVDALGKAEGVNWVWAGAQCLRPAYTLCLVELSRGGADATVTREFHLENRKFVEGGFELAEAKGGAGWIDADTLLVTTDFGAGSMTESGYPRIVKRWKRGTKLEEAETLFEGKVEDVSAYGSYDSMPGYERLFVGRAPDFFTNELYEVRGSKVTKIPKPDDANATVHRDWIYLELRKDWEYQGVQYKAGSLLAANYAKFLKGKAKIDVLFVPTETTSFVGFSPTQDHLILNTLDNVRNRIEVLTPGKKGWSRADLAGLPKFGNVSVGAVDDEENNDYWVTVSDYVTPTTLGYGTIGGTAETLKRLPSFFKADGLEVTQHFATSRDGTRIPYFQVARSDLALDGSAPTLLYGYGGFEVPLLPGYSAGVGAAWLERGGVYVVANIRGGGEFGPRWHQAALKENRHRAYEDFAAVGEDLARRKVTSPARTGILGGSNGGLLMGNMLTLYPKHWGAIVCKVPLLDMKRYHLLLAGASWMGEYGDPDKPEEWKFIQTFSPYHNLKSDAEYPPILFTTSTRDDRVHPGHARKMAARMIEMNKNVLYYENIEGGHGGAADNSQRAFMDALGYTFLWSKLGGN
jgi:prolyl oligopeptidase